MAQVTLGGTTYYLGSYPTASQAAKAYDWAARLIGNHRPLNFHPDAHLDLEEPQTKDADQLRFILALRNGLRSARLPDADQQKHLLEYIGVSFRRGDERFSAHIWWDEKEHDLGHFSTALQAALVYDWAARHIGDDRPLNFPFHEQLVDEQRTKGAAMLRSILSRKGGLRHVGVQYADEREYVGVTRRERGGRRTVYAAQIQWDGNSKHLGHFEDAEAAAKAYDWAARLLGDRPLNFDLSTECAEPTAPAARRLRAYVLSAPARIRAGPARNVVIQYRAAPRTTHILQ